MSNCDIIVVQTNKKVFNMNEDDILEAAEKMDAAPVPTEDRMIGNPEVVSQALDDLIAGETEILTLEEVEIQAEIARLAARGPRGRVGKSNKQKRVNKNARNARKTNRGNI